MAVGDATFLTFALVDGGIVARELDSFLDTSSNPVPEPASLALFGRGLLGVGNRRKQH